MADKSKSEYGMGTGEKVESAEIESLEKRMGTTVGFLVTPLTLVNHSTSVTLRYILQPTVCLKVTFLCLSFYPYLSRTKAE